MSERAAPFYCPYCGDEDLRPSEEGAGTGRGAAWECASCNRAFKLSFLGLLARGLPRGHDGDGPDATDGRAGGGTR
ncbi:hypothetical protein ACFPA8_19815 [Streptomyces ovatisporus]|uniref:Insertion element protein n=1 Tax=Streptomyces ovatisporus TaxID=1128682 RepID=A0ABV9AAQ1_9ACTN